METVVESSRSATAEEARKDLLDLLAVSNSYGVSPPNPDLYTFCACCGSQFLGADGTVGVSGLGLVRPGKDGIEEVYSKLYGHYWKRRFSNADLQSIYQKVDRKNKPGVTIAYMEKDKAIDILYEGTDHDIADGYEIHDKEQGHVLSVIWLNR